MYNKFIIVQFYIQYFLYVPYFPYGISIHVDMLRILSWGIPARGMTFGTGAMTFGTGASSTPPSLSQIVHTGSRISQIWIQ